MDAGVVNNVATASGTPPTGPPVTDQDNTTTPVTRTPAIDLDKQAGAINDLDGNGHDVGDTIAYTFLVTNTGNVTLSPVSVSDPKVGAVTCPPGPLAPTASKTCTATYTLTQGDVDAGVVNNVATASGTPPTGPPVTDQDNTTTPVTRAAAITLDKQAGVPSGNTVGSTIAYTFLVTNTGNVTLDPVSVSDPKVGAVTCPPGSLAPGASRTCTATYPLTQLDIDSGHFANTATATGTPPPGVTPPTADDDTDTPIPGGPAIDLDKQAGAINDLDGNGHDVGDTIAYTFVVTNTGNVTLSPVSVSDPKVGAVSCPPGSLAPGATRTCTATYTLTQGDVDAGVVNNVATASGTPPTGPPVTDQDNTTTPVTRAAAITLDKQAGVPSGNTMGSTIAYTFLVTNTGNVTLDPVTISDPAVGAVSCPAGPLAPGASKTCTATYPLTQLDIDSGHFANTATATGTPPPGVTPPTADDDTDTPIPAGPAIDLDKQAGAINDLDGNGADVGDTIAYTFVVTNNGNVTLSSVSVSDPKVGAVTCPRGPPGADRIEDLHGDLHADPGRRRRRSGRQHRDHVGHTTRGPAGHRRRHGHHRNPGEPIDRPGEVGRTDRRCRRERPGRRRHHRVLVPGDQHRERHVGPRERGRSEGGCGDVPARRLGTGCLEDVHGDLHDDPGRRERRVGRQHRDRDRDAADRSAGDGR